MSELTYLKAWCDAFYEKTHTRVHPQNVPVEIILNEVLMDVSYLRKELIKTNQMLLEATNYINQLLALKEDKKPKKEVKK